MEAGRDRCEIGFADGDYVMDAKLTLAGGTIEYADPLYITIQEPITL